MNELSIADLTEKVNRVTLDLESLRTSGEAGRKLEILSEYKSYLEDELRMLKNEQRSNSR
jgi:hypothetical protein